MKYLYSSKYQHKVFIAFILLMCLPLYVSAEAQNNTNWFNLIMKRIQQRHQNINIDDNDEQSTYLLSILNDDGSFSDIEYDDSSQTGWKPLAHLNRMKPLVLSYTNPNSKYYSDDILYDKIIKMFEYWYEKHPLSTNWFNQQIASPQRIGVLLILMRSGQKQLPPNLEQSLLKRMEEEGGRPDQPGSLGTGANKLDIATHWIYRGCLLEDEDILSFGAEQVYYPIFLTTNEGLQPDYSYQQHGNQLHIGAYGFAFVDGISSIACYTTGTPYEMSSEKLNHLSKFVREAYLPVIRGQYMMYNVVGRSISRKGSLSQKGFSSVLHKMKEIDPTNTLEYDAAIARIKGEKPASFEVSSQNKQFWRSDYMLHQRPEYAFDVRGSSTYTTRNENGNRESLKGYFLVDGATELVIKGNEFTDIFSVWDWSRIPGTTTPAMDTIPLPTHWQKPGNSKFAGGVSDGYYGIATYLYDDRDFSINTSAKKSWFMFDDEIVCLGADIKSENENEINTTLNQCLLVGDVMIGNASKDINSIGKGMHLFPNTSWIQHNDVGYYFPKATTVNLFNDAQSGSWYSINNSQPKDIETKDIFKLWLNHGQKPNKATYEYILLPNIDVSQLKEYTSDNIYILANNDKNQAVYHKDLDILGIVFYDASTLKSKIANITVDKPCVVMFQSLSDNLVNIYISDPSRVNSEIELKCKFNGSSKEYVINCILPVNDAPLAGATKSFTINKKTSNTHQK